MRETTDTFRSRWTRGLGGALLSAALCGAALAQGAAGRGDPDAADGPPGAVEDAEGAARPAVEIEPAERGTGRPGSLLARQIEHAAQRATAVELSGELDPLLGSDGLPIELGSARVRAQLRGVATRCDLLSHGLTDTMALRILYETQARVYNALVQDTAAHGESVEAARGLGQLRAAAARLVALDDGNAQAAGGYWQMLADLIDANRTIDSASDRRVLVRELLSRYVEAYGEADGLEPGVAAYLLDARVALARLLDEAGEQRAAAAALGPIADAGEAGERYAEARTVLDRAGAVGSPVALDLPLLSGGRWRSADHAGEPVLLHYDAPGRPDAAASIAELRRAIDRADLGGFSVVSLYAGERTAGMALPPWPAALAGPEARRGLAALGLTAVPMYVWVDADGRVAAIGKTLDILRQFPEPLEPDPADARNPAEADDAPAGRLPDAEPDAAPGPVGDPADPAADR